MTCKNTNILSQIDTNRDHRLQADEYVRSAINVMEFQALRVRAGELSRSDFARNFGSLSNTTMRNNYRDIQNLGAAYFSNGFENLGDNAIGRIIGAGRNLNSALANEKISPWDGLIASATLAFRRSKSALQCL